MNAREVLDSWKEISVYLGRDVRTCRRWETHLGLPVHRLNGSPRARVRAYKDEIDRWLERKLHEREVRAHPLAFLLRWPVAAGLVALLAVLVIGAVGWRSISNGRPRFVPSGSRPALAVLPFVNATGEEGLNYLRESVPDHLVRDLQRSAEHLKVFSFDVVVDAVRKLKLEPGAPLTPDDLAAVASGTGAGWLLVSYLNNSGSKMRIDYELRDVASLGAAGTTASAALKTDHVPGTEAEVPVIVKRVADGVRRAFGVPTSTGPGALQACTVQATRFYELARAVERKYTLTMSPSDLEKMIGLFEQAREADPGCALAYLGLGDAYQHKFVYEDLDPEALRLMKESYRKAYAMAPDRAETNIGAAWTHFFEGDNDRAYAFFKRALELDPASLHVLQDTGAFLRSIGRLSRAAEYFTKVIQAGGSTADVYMLRAWTYEQLGLFESALGDFDKMIELEPLEYRSFCHRARVLILMKRYDTAAAELATAETLAPGAPYIGLVKALAAAAKGRREEALAAIAPERFRARPVRGTYFRSRVYAALGMKDEAIGEIERAIATGFEGTYDYLYFFDYLNNTRDYFYDSLRGDPRFDEILRREERKHTEKLEKYAGL